MIKSRKVLATISLLLGTTILMACGNKNVENVQDEALTEPQYETQEMTVDVLTEDIRIIDGYEVYLMPNAGEFYVSKPHVERVKGITYWGDSWEDVDENRYQGVNCPEGAAYIQQEANSSGWEFGTQLHFGLNKDEEKEEVLYNPLHEEFLGYEVYAYSEEKVEVSGLDVKKTHKMCVQDIQCVQMALYEDFYKDKPELTFKVYGIPKSHWEKNLGSEMNYSYNQYKKFMDDNYANNYKDCVLLSEQKMTKTGVYYIDYNELSKKGDFANYILVGDFSKSCEYTYCIYMGDTYEIKDASAYNAWKKTNIDKIIAGK